MNKETVSTNSLSTDQLIQQRDKTLQTIEKREYHIGQIGHCNIKDGSSFENSLELGLRRADAKGRLAQDQEKLNDINLELVAYEQVKQYLDKVKLRQTQLDLMSQMVAQGNLFPQILEKHQNEFQELTFLSETDPVLIRGIARIRQEEERKKQSPEPKPTNDYKLTGKSAQLLALLEGSSPDTLVTSDQLTQSLWPGIPNDIARNRLGVLVSITKRKLLDEDLNIVVISDPSKKLKGEKARYLLIKKGQSDQVPESTQPEETTKIPDHKVDDKISETRYDDEEITSINKPEFGTLSRADISLIASTFEDENNRKNLEEMLEKYGIGLIGKTTMDQLIDLIDDADIANFNGMTKQQKSDYTIQLKIQALQKTKDLIESPQADEILEKIYEKNPEVWYLLAKLDDINNKLEGISRDENNYLYYKYKKGITLLTDFLTNSKETIWSYDVTDSHGVKSRKHIDRTDNPSPLECSGKN